MFTNSFFRAFSIGPDARIEEDEEHLRFRATLNGVIGRTTWSHCDLPLSLVPRSSLSAWLVSAALLLRPSAHPALRFKYVPTMASLLSNMAPDVIFSIFAFCDISSVISASETCRYLHSLAFDKSVWLGLLDNLRRRSILDRTVDLGTLSVAEMIGIVQQLITGPKTWSPLNVWNPRVEVSRKITLHPRSEPGLPRLPYKAQLLPSGRYVLFAARSILECWNVAEDRQVWKYTSVIDSEFVRATDFAAEETDTESVNIVVGVRTSPHQKTWVEIVNLNLRTGTHNVLLVARAPDFPFSVPFFQPAILGALAAVKVGVNTYMIINWAAHLYIILRTPSDNTSQIALIPQHILLMTRSPSLTGQQIHLVANDALHARWAPTSSLDGPLEFSLISAEDIPKLTTRFTFTRVLFEMVNTVFGYAVAQDMRWNRLYPPIDSLFRLTDTLNGISEIGWWCREPHFMPSPTAVTLSPPS
ncbi:hypothetical protein MSAN_01536500 [Mycena sanguinolenta]|uniref:F-box domain-containing protein n=1 Tax=Mycena sanguinolenta TaxID=230812 RepID=A0A8H7CZB1_9AGAR|nr:hypothetical protein MSAN_01536500 [Mycena sanguinolenta]